MSLSTPDARTCVFAYSTRVCGAPLLLLQTGTINCCSAKVHFERIKDESRASRARRASTVSKASKPNQESRKTNRKRLTCSQIYTMEGNQRAINKCSRCHDKNVDTLLVATLVFLGFEIHWGEPCLRSNQNKNLIFEFAP